MTVDLVNATALQVLGRALARGGVMTVDLVNATALQVYCPRCSAAPHRPCRSVRGPARGRVKAWPHDARKRAAA